jgi:hypothetical protein
MKQNLDVLKNEIQEHLDSGGFITFHGYSRTLDSLPLIMWDAAKFPDYRDFLKAAEAAGAKLVVLHTREFSAAFVDSALDQLAASELTTEDRRSIERRLRDMRAYDGFTCSIELSFDYNQRVYIFDLRTEWYEEFSDLIEDIDDSIPGEDDEEDEGSIGGYFSKN